MIRPVLCSLLLFLGTRCGAQDDLVFIIDTVLTPHAFSRPLQYPAEPRASLAAMVAHSEEYILSAELKGRSYPHVVVHFAKDTTAGPIRLQLDDTGGEFLLHWPADLKSDTIRIARFEVLKRCFRDTIATTVEWFAMSDSGLVLPCSIKQSRELSPEPTCKEVFQAIGLNINGTSYQVPLRLIDSGFGEIETFHGYKPTRCQGYRRGDARRKRCRYFHGHSETTRKCYFGEVMLK
jgi:hypothetical protein